MHPFERDSELPSVSTATTHRMLKKRRIRYKKRFQNAMSIEATLIVQSCRRYVPHIAELRRQGRQLFTPMKRKLPLATRKVVWVEETVSTLQKARRSGLSTGLQNPNGKGGRLIVIHCDNENGLVEDAGDVFRAKKSSGELS
ncbi:hypothetical protein HPB49_010568 [Dermacentor silvarum]|uniref:Uncharacterized protein n=1 Tax=Dermacentor silvarum TaxID=543639 RepID=A0ACB8C313_DERSI|nr:hypothetical protein HPB49_010568 [Dermacentor silvarum]